MNGADDDGSVDDPRSAFAEHIRDVLDREYDRTTRGIARAETIVKTQLSIITVIIAASGFILRGNAHVTVHCATVVIFIGALLAGIASLALAAYGQAKATRSSATSLKTIDDMVSPEHWTREPDPKYIVANRDRDTIRALRKTNHERAEIIDRALVLQVTFIALAVIGAVVEFAVRLV
jgi:hypothetical protein